MLSYSGITVLSFANKVVKVQPQKFVRSFMEYQGCYNIVKCSYTVAYRRIDFKLGM